MTIDLNQFQPNEPVAGLYVYQANLPQLHNPIVSSNQATALANGAVVTIDSSVASTNAPVVKQAAVNDNIFGVVTFNPVKAGFVSGERVAIARALCMKPKVLLFDEPTSALDPEMIEEVLALIMEVSKKNIIMIVVTHELKFAYDFATRVIFMDKGQIVEDGEKEQIFKHPKTERLQKFLSNIK